MTMDIPDGIAMKVHAKVIKVKGPRGKLTRDCKYINCDFQLIKTPSPGRDSSRSTRGLADRLSQIQFFNLNCFEQC
ncbi:BnaCnng60060D [Brassica napus]|uniref:Uncharacterized protein n=3 Tax=Brassica TaxID=3705 RepID=A0A0D3CSI5_BRAOL|nr:unnamed protein product [Brassica napus]CDY68682.1 BnaCnng60060D [Brassica napus]VDD61400.1 unnamed protein product [Brassica oleracea]